MKAWQKGAIAGFMLGFIHWTYVVIRIWNMPHYQFTKYSVAFYSFFYGVVLVGVSLGLLVFILDRWKNWPVTLMFGALWGILSGVLLGIGLSATRYYSVNLYSLDIGTIFLYFPAWISFLFFEIIFEPWEPPIQLPSYIGTPLAFLIIVTMGIISCIIFVSLTFSIGYRISKLIGRVRTK